MGFAGLTFLLQPLLLADETAVLPARDNGQGILILNSYHLGYSWSDAEMDGLLGALRVRDPEMQPWIEYMDSKRFDSGDGDLPALLFRYYSEKYRQKPVRLLILLDNPALELGLKFRKKFLPNVPIVFCGINNYSPGLISGERAITGVAEKLDIRGTLDAMIRIHPEAKKILVVNDFTTTGRASRQALEEVIPEYSERLAFRFTDDVPIDQITEQLRHLSRDTLVLLLSFARDRSGQVFDHGSGTRRFTEASSRPVYAVHETRFGHGIVGGSLLAGRAHGELAAEEALEILAGKAADSIPVDQTGRGRLMFDYPQLVKYRIPEKALPLNREILNRPDSLFHKYLPVILITLAVVLGLAAAVVFLSINVTKRKRAEKARARAESEKEKMQAQLFHSDKLAMIGTLAAGVAHEINNPLTIISANAEMIADKISEDAPASEVAVHLEKQRYAITRITDIVSSLRIYSRAELENVECMDLNKVVGDTLALSDYLYRRASIRLEIKLESSAPYVLGNPGRLQQVLMNLIANARDALEGHAGKPAVLVKTEDQDQFIAIMISDNGCGIETTALPRIFDPFYTTKPAGKGTGLGLSISQSIINGMGGVIRAESQVGIGTSFTITLPRASIRDGSPITAE